VTTRQRQGNLAAMADEQGSKEDEQGSKEDEQGSKEAKGREVSKEGWRCGEKQQEKLKKKKQEFNRSHV
jgi:hypothetical protein